MNYVFLVFFALMGCSNGLFQDVQGSLKSTSPTTLVIPASPAPTITILGRTSSEFSVSFAENTLNTPLANFTISQVPNTQPILFKVTGIGLDPIVSFPYDLNIPRGIVLAALPAGTTDAIVASIETISGTDAVRPDDGMVVGQLSSSGGGCVPSNSVVLKNKLDGRPVVALGPFYFDPSGNVVNSNQFSDDLCSYVIANLLPGNYVLEVLDSTIQVVDSIEVVVLSGIVTFGLDLP